MNAKDKILKIGFPVLFILVLSTVLTFVFCLPKTHASKLEIYAENMTLALHEEKTLDYKVSIPYAVVSFKIENKEILSATGFNVKALKIGETKIEFEAKYKDKISKYVCTIRVENTTPNPDNGEENMDPENPIIFNLINQDGCLIEGTTLKIPKNEVCFFRVSLETTNVCLNYELMATPSITLSKIMSFNTWKISATNSGKIDIVSNENNIGTIDVVVI